MKYAARVQACVRIVHAIILFLKQHLHIYICQNREFFNIIYIAYYYSRPIFSTYVYVVRIFA